MNKTNFPKGTINFSKRKKAELKRAELKNAHTFPILDFPFVKKVKA